MKKTIITILALVLFSAVSAQHLKFEGIPIDGSITNFQNQLSSKGISINSAKSKDAPLGQRVFNGKYQGYNSEITVFYGRKSKVVYKVNVVIESTKKEVIQNILDRSLKKIEEKYLYTTDHDLNDDTRPKFRFNIFPTETSKQSIGVIQVNPSHAYYITGDDNKPLEFACFTITFVYEDRVNTDLTLPSDLEPHTLPGFTCGDPESFGKFSKWMLNFMQNGCYENARLYLFWLLDYYKYDCIPSYVHDFENGESQIDELIKTLDGYCLGTIPAGVGMRKEKVYKVFDSESQEFKFVEFDARYYQSMLTNHIKLDKYDLSQFIRSLEYLNTKFSARRKLDFPTSNITWTEKIEATYLPAYVGSSKPNNGEYGDIEWEHTQLMAYYSVRDGDLTLNITANNEFEFVFWFKNNEQVDSVIRFLKTIQL